MMALRVYMDEDRWRLLHTDLKMKYGRNWGYGKYRHFHKFFTGKDRRRFPETGSGSYPVSGRNRKMWPLPVSELFGVGKVTETKLLRWAIYTIGDLAKSDESFIYSNLKTPGLILQKYARGGDLEPYIYTPVAKGYGNSLTAPQDVVTEAYAKHLLLSLVETIGTRLREDNVTIRVVSVHITTFEFQYFHKQRQLFTATNVTEEIYRAACGLFHDLWDGRTPIRQLGIHTTQVQTDAGRQYNLFDLQKFDRLEKLDRTVDQIRKKYGEDSIFRACYIGSKVSHMSGGLDKERRTGVTVGIDIEKEKREI